jgi:hypothetical protein
MVFTRKYKPEPIEILKFGGREVVFTNSVKYLGVLLDPKIVWKQHITERKEKFFSSMWACRRAMCKSWGMSHKALWMYKKVLYPQVLYVSMVCCPVVSRIETTNLLRSLQSSYLRAAVGFTYETYTYKALEVALRLAPLYLTVNGAARFTAD